MVAFTDSVIVFTCIYYVDAARSGAVRCGAPQRTAPHRASSVNEPKTLEGQGQL